MGTSGSQFIDHSTAERVPKVVHSVLVEDPFDVHPQYCLKMLLCIDRQSSLCKYIAGGGGSALLRTTSAAARRDGAGSGHVELNMEGFQDQLMDSPDQSVSLPWVSLMLFVLFGSIF